MFRRLTDIFVACAALVTLSPALGVVALAVALDSPGGVFYRSWRVGKGGRRFRMLKFRTMVRHADRVGPGITAKHDPRITRVGRFLRASKLDEMPQFWNLFTGDLTLVGPRAEIPEIVERYTPGQRKILAFKPGITGLGTLHYVDRMEDTFPENVPALDHYVNHLLDEKLRIDLDYLESRTAAKDARLVLRTVGTIVRAVLGGRA